MKRNRLLSLVLAMVMLMTLLTGCGGSARSNVAMDKMAYAEEAAPEAAMAMAMNASGSLTSNSTAGSGALPENRKWIVTVDMNAETEDLDAMLTALDEKILTLEGYVENQNVYNGSTYASSRYRNANLTIRIPAQVVDQFTQEVSGIANVVRKETSKEDVTLSYVDTESRKKALETEEARLLELLAQAETMSDLLEIEARLTDVRYELESAASRLRTYDNRIDYATIYLYIEEVQEYTPVAEKTVWQRITDGFSESLEDLGESLVDFFVWLIVASPFLVVYGGIAVALFLLIRVIRKKRPASRPRKWRKKGAASEPKTEEKE